MISTHYPKYVKSSASALIESHLSHNRVGSLLYAVGDKVYHLASFFLRLNHLWTILMRFEAGQSIVTQLHDVPGIPVL